MNHDVVTKIAIKLQRRFRARKIAQRLHCANLAERLLFESHVVRGTFRLLNQVAIFMLMVAAAFATCNPTERLGLFDNLKNAFHLSSLGSVATMSRTAFQQEFLPAVSKQSKDFFALSSTYFDTSKLGAVQLIGPETTFILPRAVPGVPLSVQLPEISFTVWANVDLAFVRGYILRKRERPVGYGSDSACWGWFLDRFKGPQLHFGAHDAFPTRERCVYVCVFESCEHMIGLQCTAFSVSAPTLLLSRQWHALTMKVTAWAKMARRCM